MKILIANKYLFPKGGADVIFYETARMLRRKGHQVLDFSMRHPRNFASEHEAYFVDNIDYEKNDLASSVRSSAKLLYSLEAKKKIEALIKRERPDVAELHNIYHQISPSILHSLKKFGIPTVMLLQDYKVVCASYSMIAGGKICEACKGGKYYNCFLKACVKESKMKSLLNTMEMVLHHKLFHIYDLVDVFISPSHFLAEKVKEMGFKGKIVHLSNFVNVDQYTPDYGWKENTFCFAGRLSKEKGILTLLEAARGVNATLKIIGEGPMKEELVAYAKKNGIHNVTFLGFKTGEELKSQMRNSMFAVISSEWYENNPLSVMESFALGKPVIGSRLGGIPELVRDGQTGLTFEAGNASDLREKIVRLIRQPQEIERMGRQARQVAEKELDAEGHYQGLMKIFTELTGKQGTPGHD